MQRVQQSESKDAAPPAARRRVASCRYATALVRRGLVFSELLLLILVLLVVFGLIVNLARRVRRESNHQLAARVLVELEAALAGYRDETGEAPAVIPSLLPAEYDAGRLTDIDLAAFGEAVLNLDERALANNRASLRLLAFGFRRAGEDADAASASSLLVGTLGDALFDGGTLRDPWGSPFAYMAGGSPLIGTAAGNRPYFFSAGPDGLYLTRGDNLYGYELTGGDLPLSDLASLVDDSGDPPVDTP